MMRQVTSQPHPASPAARAVDLVLDPGRTSAAPCAPPVRYNKLSRYDEPIENEPDPLPVWISAILLVAYCAIFWVGAITIGSWCWHALATAFLP